LNDIGAIAHKEWQQLPTRFQNIKLDKHVIMPNHMHGIINIQDHVGATFMVAQDHAKNSMIDIDETIPGDAPRVAYISIPSNDVIGVILLKIIKLPFRSKTLPTGISL
jgi:hypothetical protein